MKKNVYKTASAVTTLSVAERTLGFLYRIALSRLIGAEGLGLYQVSLALFSVFVTLGTGGIPVTVSRLISKAKTKNDKNGEYSSLTAGILASFLLTLPIFLVIVFFGRKLTFLSSDKRVLSVLSILIYGLFFTCIYAVIRGSFWGNKKFLLTSTLELLEEIVMVIVGILTLQNISNPFSGAKIAAVAVIISYTVSFSLSVISYFICKGKIVSPKPQFKPLFTQAMPITLVRTASSFTSSLVAIILPLMLVKAGFTESGAVSVFGVISGMVMPILSIPSTIIGSISLVLIPELSENFYSGNKSALISNVNKGIFSSLFISCLLSPVFFLTGKDVGLTVYKNVLAGDMISLFSFTLIPMSITMMTTAILNSIGYEKTTLISFFSGTAFMIASILILPKYVGGYAYLIGNALSFLTTSLINLIFLSRLNLITSKLIKKCAVLLLLMLPTIILGKFLSKLLTFVSTAVLSVIVSSAFACICFMLLCFASKIISVKKILKNT